MCTLYPSSLWGLKPGVASSFPPPCSNGLGEALGQRKGRMGSLAPGFLAGVLLLCYSSGLNWAAGRMNFSGTSSCLTSPEVGVSSLAASQKRVLCHFSHPLQRCCLPQVSKGAALSPQGQGAGSQTWSPVAGDLFWLEVQLCPYF